MSDGRPTECDSCGQSLVSFSREKLEDGTCPFCKDPHTTDDAETDGGQILDSPPQPDRVPESERLRRRSDRMKEDKRARDKRLGLRGRR